MNTCRQRKGQTIITIVLVIACYTNCAPIDNAYIDVTTPCQDAAEAINRVYDSLPREMQIDDRCKRYAVLLAMAEQKDVSEQLALLQLTGLTEDLLDILYKRITNADMAARYMTTIDMYRASHLEPAFIDLIDCLRQIDLPLVKNYLDDLELTKIVDLYRRALGPPATDIDLDAIDLYGFRPELRQTLKSLFQKHFETIGQDRRPESSQVNFFNHLSPSYKSLRRTAERFVTQLRQRIRGSRWQSRKREQNLDYHREKDRIRKKQKRAQLRLERELDENISTEREESPEGLTYQQLARLERTRVLRREAQRRYRERRRELRRQSQPTAEQNGKQNEDHSAAPRAEHDDD